MNFKILIKYIKKHQWSYMSGLFTLFIVDYFSTYIPEITGMITDGLANYTVSLNDVLLDLLYLLFIALIITIGRIGWRYFLLGASRKIESELRNDMYQKLQTLDQDYFNNHKTGDLMAVFTNDLDALRKTLGPAVISIFDAVIMTVLVLYKMIIYVDLRLTLLTLIPMALIAIGSCFFIDLFEKRFLQKQNAFAKLSDYVQESITGERVIKSFVEENNQDYKFDEENMNNKKMNMKVVKLMATVMPLLDFVIGSSYVITIIFGGYLAITGQITLGRFIAFSQYISMLVWPMIAFGDSITYFSSGKAALKRMTEIFQQIPKIKDCHPIDVQELKGNIKINNLSFKYQDDLPNVIQDINLDLHPGQTLAILGRTGSGKTTFVDLLMRIYETKRNMITIDGYNIQDIPIKILRNHIAYVPQDNYLFSDTLENNIKFGNFNASHEKVEEVCKQACIHDNIIDFPNKYQTIVGERGVTLSGGQKQRCSIARALLKDAPILILDDSLSAVDTNTEEYILENLRLRNKNQTVIMITHRVSTVKNADFIMYLEDGKMVELGTYDELLNSNSHFRKMYDKQQLEKQLEKD